MTDNKLRRYTAIRNSCINEIQVLSSLADAAKKDKSQRTLFKVRFAEIETIHSEFIKNHSNIISLLSADEGSDLDTEDKVKSDYNQNLYNARAIYSELFDSGVDPNVSRGGNNTAGVVQSHAKLARIELPKFGGDYRQFQTFKDMYDALVHSDDSLKDIEKFNYLVTSLQGPPLALVQSTPMTAANYNIAYSSFVKRYSNLRAQAKAYWTEIENHPILNSANALSLRKLMDTFSDNLAGLKNLGLSVDGWDFILVHMILKRLDSDTVIAFEKEHHNANTIPTYKKLQSFLEEHCTALESVHPPQREIPKNANPASSQSFKKSPFSYSMNTARKNTKISTPNTFVATTETKVSLQRCVLCKENHPLFRCPSFQNKCQTERYLFCKNLRLCFNCLSSVHDLRSCQSTSACKSCGSKSHHTLLHRDKIHSIGTTSTTFETLPIESQSSIPSSNSPQVNINAATASRPSQVLLSTAMVAIQDGQGIYQKFRALLDSASETSLISQKCFSRLNLKKFNSSTTVQGVGDANKLINVGGVTIFLKPLYADNPVFLIDALILPKICEPLPTTQISPASWPHLSNLELADPNFNCPSEIDILLGADIFSQILLSRRVSGNVGEPAALETVFGYVLIGKIENSLNPHVRSFFCSSIDVTPFDETIKTFFEVESVPINNPMSLDDRRCEEIYVQHTTRDKFGKYIVPLPFREPFPHFSGSRELAVRRFLSLERRLLKNPELHKEYCKVIQEYLDLGHMEPVSSISIPDTSFYLPHHCVVRPESKSTKVRIVFNASANSGDQFSLNQCLYVGHKLQSDIGKVLLNFRFHKICFTADICKMFRQIWVHPQFRDYQRLIFRFSPREKLSDFRIKCVCFGINCSPFLALRTIDQLRMDDGQSFPRAAEVLKSDIYIDDICTGANSLINAEKLRDELIALLGMGGFSLRKWTSNNHELFQNLAPEHVSTDPLNFDTDSQSMKILGLLWNPLQDSFSFSVCTSDRVCTKRNLLSEFARIFDPLGMLSPVTFLTKQLIKRLWALGLHWDDPPDEDILRIWYKYKNELPLLSSLRVPRRLVIDDFSSVEIHGFSDASERGHSAVVYFRVISTKQTCVFFVCGKSKVAPTKILTIPRLELCGAVLLTKLIAWVVKSYEGRIKFSHTFAYTDSQIVLAWIRAEATRWTTFVANRVSFIQDELPSASWFHINSKDNPADCASRGLFPSEILDHHLWFKGPSFLYLQGTFPCDVDNDFNTHEEERKVSLAIKSDSNIVDFLLIKFSSFTKIKNILTFILKFIHHFFKSADERLLNMICLSQSPPNEDNALELMVKRTQTIYFSNELESKSFSKPLKKLNAFFDSKGILRVGGRLTYSNLNFDKKHQILLPKKCRLTELLIEFFHKKYLHVGLKTVHFLIAQKFWILSAVRAIRSILGKCIQCWRTNPTPLQPKMGNLPISRISQVKAFSHTGIDYGGPFFVTITRRRGCKPSKMYICLFVCMATKAIHLEIAFDLTSEAFLAALRRFIGRRGRCSHLYSDQGSNFVGASKILNSIVTTISESEAITHHFLAPSSPHMGGLWEAGIKSVKTHIKRVVGDQILSFEEFHTLLIQIESILNSRPLTPLSTDPNDVSALTPGHFLTLEPLCPLVDENLNDIPLNRLSRFQMIQKLNAQFWRRWHAEYLHTLQQRSKWLEPETVIEPGRLVVIKSDDARPMKWPLARIIELHPGEDGLSRIATLKTATGVLQRPLVKLCALPIS